MHNTQSRRSRLLAARAGITLMEVLIFTAIFGVIIVAFVAIFTSTIGIQANQSSKAEISQESAYLMQKIETAVGETTGVALDKDVASTTLTLRMASSSEDPTTIYLSSSTVYIQSGSSPAEALTSNKVRVASLTFTRRLNYPGHDTVAVQFMLEDAGGKEPASFRSSFEALNALPAPPGAR